MTKKILMVALAMVLAAGVAGKAAAQSRVQLGVRAGITSQDMELRIADFGGDNFKTNASLGWHLAAVSRIRLTAVGRGVLGLGLFLQPEIIYSQNNYKMNKTGESGVSKIRMESVDVPVLLSLKVSIVRVQAGPVFSAMYRNEAVKGDVDIEPRKPLVGYSAGLSVDIFGGLVFDGRFNGQFKELKNSIKAGETAYNSVHGSLSSWSVGLSWLF